MLEVGRIAQHTALLLRHAMCTQALGAELTWCLRTVSASTRSVMLAWWATQTVATVSGFADYEQTVTTIVRMTKMHLNFKDP